MTHKARVIAALKRGKAFFTDKDKLVKDWGHILETKTGEWVPLHRPQGACRACILGGLYTTTRRSSDVRTDARWLIGRVAGELYRRHTLREVRAIYDKAIKLAEEEDAL